MDAVPQDSNDHSNSPQRRPEQAATMEKAISGKADEKLTDSGKNNKHHHSKRHRRKKEGVDDAKKEEAWKKYATTQFELERIRLHAKHLEEERQRSHAQVVRMSFAVKANEMEIAALQQQLTDSMDRLEELQEDRNEEMERIASREEQLEDALEKVRWVQDESLAKTEQIERFEDELYEKNELIEKLRGDLDVKCKRVVDLEVELEAACGRLKGMAEAQLKWKLEQSEQKSERHVMEGISLFSPQVNENNINNDKGRQCNRRSFFWGGGNKMRQRNICNDVGGHNKNNKNENDSISGGGSGEGSGHATLSTMSTHSCCYETQLLDGDMRIEDLQRTIELNQEIIHRLRSDIVHLKTTFKDEKYKNSVQIEKLTQESMAYSIKAEALEKQLQQLNGGDVKNTDEGGNTDVNGGKKLLENKREPIGADEAAGLHHQKEEKSQNSSQDGKTCEPKMSLQQYRNKNRELESRVMELEKERQLYHSTIEKLNSDMTKLRMMSKNEQFKGRLELEALRQENEANSIKVAALEKQFQDVNNIQWEVCMPIEERDEKNNDSNTTSSSPSRLNKKHVVKAETSKEKKEETSKIALLEKNCKTLEKTVVALRSELFKVRMQLKSQAYQNRQQLEGLNNENSANSIKVAVLEREFQEVNNVISDRQIQVDKSKTKKIDEDAADGNASTTSPSIVSVDASYLADLKHQLAKKQELIEAMDDEILAYRAITRRVEEDCKREMASLNPDGGDFLDVLTEPNSMHFS